MNQIRAARSPWILWIAAAAFALVTLACETGEPAAPPSEDEIAANTATATAEPPADSAGTAAPAPTAATTAASGATNGAVLWGGRGRHLAEVQDHP